MARMIGKLTALKVDKVARHEKPRPAGHADGYVFPGGKPGRPLSNMALLTLLRRMGHAELTAHGFRATFKTWASERTSYQSEIVETSLAHVVGNKVQQAFSAVTCSRSGAD